MPPAWAHAALAQRRAQVDAFVAEALALLALARQAGHSRFGGRGFAQQPGLPLARSRERV
ncbi:amidase [Bordetella pertussis]|nr:amidase [Bordetella pertussis]